VAACRFVTTRPLVSGLFGEVGTAAASRAISASRSEALAGAVDAAVSGAGRRNGKTTRSPTAYRKHKPFSSLRNGSPSQALSDASSAVRWLAAPTAVNTRPPTGVKAAAFGAGAAR
jgi:hypothetical protein